MTTGFAVDLQFVHHHNWNWSSKIFVRVVEPYWMDTLPGATNESHNLQARYQQEANVSHAADSPLPWPLKHYMQLMHNV